MCENLFFFHNTIASDYIYIYIYIYTYMQRERERESKRE